MALRKVNKGGTKKSMRAGSEAHEESDKLLAEKDVEDNIIFNERALSKRAEIKYKRFYDTTIWWVKIIAWGAVCILIVFAVIFAIAILGSGVANFILPCHLRWLEDERLNEIKALLTGGGGAVLASMVAKQLRDSKKN